MPLPEAIWRAWRETDYRVRLARGGCAVIRVGQPLPAALRGFLHGPDEPWGFVTAWNPVSVAQPRFANRMRQRELRDVLRAQGFRFLAGAGVGPDGWREPSLFVCGIDFDTLDALSRRFRQAAIVRGGGEAELHALI